MTFWLIPFSLQSILLGHLFCGALLALGMAKQPRYVRAVLVVTFRPWVARRWKFSTNIGHGVAVHPEAWDRSFEHEIVHIRQVENLCMLGCWIAGAALASGSPWLALGIWASSGSLWFLPNLVNSAIRYWRRGVPFLEAVYYRSEHERAAYAEINGWWLD